MKNIYIKIVQWILTCMLFVVDKTMRHFLVLRGLDPDAPPEQALYQALTNVFNKVEDVEYDPDQESHWLKKQYSKIHDKFPDISLDDYKNISNLNKTMDNQFPLQVVSPKISPAVEENTTKVDVETNNILDTAEDRAAYRNTLAQNILKSE